MLYEFLHGTARAALRFYYADVHVIGREHIPQNKPILVVANHPNALVDAMLIATTLESKVFITARATLFETRILSSFLRRLGVIPLLRAQDVDSMAETADFRTRNQVSRTRVTDTLKQHMTVLVFPEGISHDGPTMAPLRSGAARLALQARESGVTNLQILPIGLAYEEKEKPDTSICVQIGKPIDVDGWHRETASRSPADLTREIARRLGRLASDYPSRDWLVRAERLATTLAFVHSGTSGASVERSSEGSPSIAIFTVARALQQSPPQFLARVEAFVNGIDVHAAPVAFQHLNQRDAAPHGYTRDWGSFARDVSFVLLSSPFAFLGRVTSGALRWIARFLALRSLKNDPSRDQPAMRAILIALALFPLNCALVVVTLAPYVGLGLALMALILTLSATATHLFCRDKLSLATQQIARHFSQPSCEAADASLRVRAWTEEASAIIRELRQAVE